MYALLRAEYQQQHAARSELPGDPAPAPRSATVRSEPPGTPDPRLRRRCPQGNTYNTPGGTNSNGGSSYHYSNSNGSYYYAKRQRVDLLPPAPIVVGSAGVHPSSFEVRGRPGSRSSPASSSLEFTPLLSRIWTVSGSDIDSYTAQLLLSCCWCKVVPPER